MQMSHRPKTASQSQAELRKPASKHFPVGINCLFQLKLETSTTKQHKDIVAQEYQEKTS